MAAASSIIDDLYEALEPGRVMLYWAALAAGCRADVPRGGGRLLGRRRGPESAAGRGRRRRCEPLLHDALRQPQEHVFQLQLFRVDAVDRDLGLDQFLDDEAVVLVGVAEHDQKVIRVVRGAVDPVDARVGAE